MIGLGKRRATAPRSHGLRIPTAAGGGEDTTNYRITEDSETRLTEDGQIRVIE